MTRDFSDEAKEKLLEMVTQVNDEKICDLTDGIGDFFLGLEKWSGILRLNSDMSNVDNYHKKMIDRYNTSAQQILDVFTNVKAVDAAATVQLGAYDTHLKEIITLINSMTSIVAPSNGEYFSAEEIGKLNGVFDQYAENRLTLRAIEGADLTEEETEGINQRKVTEYLNRILANSVAILPDIKAGTEIRIPVGINGILYYKVSVKYDGPSDVEINFDSEIKEQKAQLSKIEYKAETDGRIKIGGGADSEGESKIVIGGGIAKTEVNMDGEHELSGTVTVNEHTSVEYKIKITKLGSVAYEETVTTKTEHGEVSSTLGIEMSPRGGGPTAVPVLVDVPVEAYERGWLENIDWEAIRQRGMQILKTTAIVICAIVVIAGVVYAVVATGGGAAVLIPVFV